jgi:hypothetical protein
MLNVVVTLIYSLINEKLSRNRFLTKNVVNVVMNNV